MIKQETKNKVVFTFRLEKSTLAELEKLSKFIKMDKTDMVREAIEDYLDDVWRENGDYAIEDYINLRIDEKQLKEITEMETIPKDLQNARKEKLASVVKKSTKSH